LNGRIARATKETLEAGGIQAPTPADPFVQAGNREGYLRARRNKLIEIGTSVTGLSGPRRPWLRLGGRTGSWTQVIV